MMIIERFEGDFAVVEYEEGLVFGIPRCLLPPGAKEGAVLTMVIAVDEPATEARKRNIEKLMDELFE